MPARSSTKSYAGRQVDIELLKHVEDPAAFKSLRNVGVSIQDFPRIVAGAEKAVQRYAVIFLSQFGSIRLDPNVGNDLLSQLSKGRISNRRYLSTLAALANTSTLATLRRDDSDDRYGDIPDDERVVNSQVIRVDLIRDALAGGRAEVGVRLTTAAGDDFTFVIPVAAGVNG